MGVRLTRLLTRLLFDYMLICPADFGLTQILPMLDEETGAEPRVDSASIADPYLLLVRDDASVSITKIDKNLELDELEKEDPALSSTKWATGCLYEDRSGVFAKAQSDKGTGAGENIMMFLLSKTGALHVGGPFITLGIVANGPRCTLCLISPNLSMLRKACPSCRRYFQQIMQRDEVRPKILLKRYWWPI